MTVELQFSGHLAADGTLTFTVQAQAIANYDGAALTAELPVPAGLGPFDRDPDKDFNTLSAAGNDRPEGLWSDGVTMWVADPRDEKLYAYDMATKARDPGKDFDTLGGRWNRASPGSLVGRHHPCGWWTTTTPSCTPIACPPGPATPTGISTP